MKKTMKKTMTKKLAGSIAALSLSCAFIGGISCATGNMDNVASDINPNSAVTSCWMGKCKHKGLEYIKPSSGYTVHSSSRLYRSLGYYCDVGQQVTVCEGYSYTQTISTGLEVGPDEAKASIGISGSFTKNYSVSTALTNRKKKRQYVHAGITVQMKEDSSL